MKTLLLFVSMFGIMNIGATKSTLITNSIQVENIQFKLKNDTKETFIYYINNQQFEVMINGVAGISYPINTIIKVINTKTNKEKEFIIITNELMGKTILVSEISK